MPLLLILSLILIALRNPDTAENTSKDSSSTSDPKVEKKYQSSPEADSLLVQSNDLLRKGEYQNALSAVEQSLQLNKEIGNYRAIGDCYNRIATIYYYQGDFKNAINYFEDGIVSYQEANFLSGIATLVNNKGAIYYYLGNYPKALEHYKKAASLNATLNNKMQSATTIQNIGGIYLELQDYNQAMKHFQQAKTTYEELADTLSLSQIKNSIGDVYLSKKSFDLALTNFEEALALAESINAQQSILEVYYNLGDAHDQLENFDLAMDFYTRTKSLADKINNTLYQSLSYIGLGTIHLDAGAAQKGIKFCRKGLQISTEIETVSIQQEACECLYEAHKQSGQNTLALNYLEQSISLKDSLNSRQTADKILNMEFEKKMILDSLANVEKEMRIELAHKEVLRQQETQRNIIVVVLFFIIIIAIAIWSRLNYVKKSKQRLQKEKDRSEHLLLNILPQEIAEELKSKGFVDAQDFESAAILFTDFKGFTATAAQLSPQDLVQELNTCFKAFDNIIGQYRVEKIKTIGDAYMAVGGVPRSDKNSVKNTILAALEMQEFIADRKEQNELLGKSSFEMRIGIHAGPIVAGVVGVKKFQYDIWGDTVNTASRMESNGQVGRVNISKSTYLVVKDEKDLAFEYRGRIDAKGKGEIDMYFVYRSSEGLNRRDRQPELVSY
ncbi:MAG: adenylate/guanylate cyclase domain-containing protein [Bacteroidota bacterium]